MRLDKTEEYKAAAEKYYTGLVDDPELHVKLTGSWETLLGPDMDSFGAFISSKSSWFVSDSLHKSISSSSKTTPATIARWHSYGAQSI